ncbi:MAG: hypothetical protein JSW06_09990 [Thermoplasmatales archaeon]|nr:MAG: hypothetical protein JSW06_09990 [Thermoplasmatales archaeon]
MSREVVIPSLDAAEIDVLLRLYYHGECVVDTLFKSLSEKEILQRLSGETLVSTSLASGETIVSLTEEGLNVCGSIMANIVQEKVLLFREKIKAIPEKAVACLINHILCREDSSEKKVFLVSYEKPYALDENLWFEKVLLKDERITKMLGRFYSILESLGFIKTMNSQYLCSSEIEMFLKNEYKDVEDLSWMEEDSLKYYYFFYVYAQDQKNLIDFSGDGEEFRSQFFGDYSTPPDYWFSSNRLNPRSLLSNLGINEGRILEFLESMQRAGIVSERNYPLTSLSFFTEGDKIYAIRDVKEYMHFITLQFLTPVVDSLLKIN